MAYIEYIIGSEGPFLIDADSPLLADPRQLIANNGMYKASATVVDETAFGQSASPGVSLEYARGDHTHGTPEDPTSGYITDAPSDGKYYVRRNGAWEELVIA